MMANYIGVCFDDMTPLNLNPEDFNWATFDHNGHNVQWTNKPPMNEPVIVLNKNIEQAIVASESNLKSDSEVLKEAMARLSTIALEREDAIRALFLSLIAKQHIVFYGEGGTGKTWLVRHFADMVDMQYFYYQIYQATTDAELFGSINYKKMHDEGEMTHVRKNSMLEAQIAFLDEIGNSSSVIRNRLKGPMEERNFKDGYENISMPLQMIVGASNSIIEYKKDATEAAFADRWLSRVHVQRIQKPENRVRLLKLRWEENNWPKIGADVIMRMQSLLGQVEVSDELYASYDNMRNEILADSAAGNLDIGDRRQEHTMLLVRANALLNGRMKVKRSDFIVYGLTAWNNHQEHEDAKLYDWLKAKLQSSMVEIEGYESQIDETYQIYQASISGADGPVEAIDILSNGQMAVNQILRMGESVKRLRPRLEDDEELSAVNALEKKIENYKTDILLRSAAFAAKSNDDDVMGEHIANLKK